MIFLLSETILLTVEILKAVPDEQLKPVFLVTVELTIEVFEFVPETFLAIGLLIVVEPITLQSMLVSVVFFLISLIGEETTLFVGETELSSIVRDRELVEVVMIVAGKANLFVDLCFPAEVVADIIIFQRSVEQ